MKAIGERLKTVRQELNSNMGEALLDNAEVILDQFIQSDAIADIPVLGTIIKVAKSGQSIKESLTRNQLGRFLHNLEGIPESDLNKFKKNLPNTTESLKELGENLLLVIERLDHTQKPQMLAQCFIAYIRGDITAVEFARLAKSIERLNFALLPHLESFYGLKEPTEVGEDIFHELSLTGLITASLMHSGTFGGSAEYVHSPIGKLFMKICVEKI